MPAAAPAAHSTIGLCIGTYGTKTLKTDEALRLIAETGYDGVEVALMPGWPTEPARIAGRSVLR